MADTLQTEAADYSDAVGSGYAKKANTENLCEPTQWIVPVQPNGLGWLLPPVL